MSTLLHLKRHEDRYFHAHPLHGMFSLVWEFPVGSLDRTDACFVSTIGSSQLTDAHQPANSCLREAAGRNELLIPPATIPRNYSY